MNDFVGESRIRRHWQRLGIYFVSFGPRIEGRRYMAAGGWWFRIGSDGPGLSYLNIGVGGYHPLFSERNGRDRTVAVRFGPHLFKLLRPIRTRKVSADV